MVQRTNTNGDSTVILEYKAESEFNEMVESSDEDVLNYFTVDEDGNLVYAKWDYIEVDVEGTYPDEVEQDARSEDRAEYIITTGKIAYSEYVKKYTMPFDFLVQLLVILEDPEFCEELVEYVLNSKIIINIQEEETVTVTTEVQNYTVHNKDEKYIDYSISEYAEIESNSDYLLSNTTDDEGNECTNYSSEEYQVTVTQEYISHSYSLEIIEADVWIGHYIKTYASSSSTTEGPNTTETEELGEYQDSGDVITTTTFNSATESDEDVQEFKQEREEYYSNNITIPTISISNTTDEDGTKYKKISVSPTDMIDSTTLTTDKYEIDGDGNYTLPYSFAVTTKATDEIPRITYIYLYNEDNGRYQLYRR